MVISYYKIWRTIRRKVPGDVDEHGNRLVDSCKGRDDRRGEKQSGDRKAKPGSSNDIALQTRRQPVSTQNGETSRKHSPNISANREATKKSGAKDDLNNVTNDTRITKLEETRFMAQPIRSEIQSARNSTRHANQSRSGTSSSVNNIATMVSNRRGSRSNRRSSKSTKICAYISVVYIILTVPSITTQLLFHSEFFKASQTFSDIMLICYMVSLWNTVSNPLVYAVLYRNFWLELKEICIKVSDTKKNSTEL